MREEILETADLTNEQRAKIDSIYEEYGDAVDPETVRRRIEAVGRVLTPAQRDAAAAMMRKRLLAHMNDRLQMLPPEERRKFMQKLDARFEQRRREIEGAIAAPGPPQ
jgi:Spy/CpxP family protein refolding chaperone